MPRIGFLFDSGRCVPEDHARWTAYPPNNGAPIEQAQWAPWVQWPSTRAGGDLPEEPGAYIVEMNGIPVTAGVVLSLANVFGSHSMALHELGLGADALAGLQVRWARVEVRAEDEAAQPLLLAGEWLRRFLLVRDFGLGGNTRHFVEIAGNQSFNAPAGGLSIRFDPVKAPAYFSNEWARAQRGWTAENDGTAGFDYAADANVLP